MKEKLKEGQGKGNNTCNAPLMNHSGEILDATMKKLVLQLLFSPTVSPFYSSLQVCRPITTQVRKNQNGESCCSLAYSFRDPDEESAYWEESKKKSTSLRSSSSSANGSSDSSETNDNIGGAVVLDENEIDIVGSGTLGDIMSGPAAPKTKQTLNSSQSSSPSSTTADVNNEKVIDGLVTKEGGELNTRFNCNFSPMERIALTSNGNLQRIFSSYYDAPVHVHIDFCSRRTEDETTTAAAAAVLPTDGTRRKTSVMDYYTSNTYSNFDIIDKNNKYSPKEDMGKDKNCSSSSSSSAIWDRIVHIHIHGQTICRATSIISVKDPTCIRLIENGTMGIGQLFRYLDRLPTFSLVDAGRTTTAATSAAAAAAGGGGGGGKDLNDNSSGTNDVSFFEGGIWRTYELKCDEMTCLIHEEFHKDAWNISPEGTSNGGTVSPFKPLI
jgi:hypothetical protein